MSIAAVFFDMGGTIQHCWCSSELRLRATPDFQKILVNSGVELGLTDLELYEMISTGLDRYREWRAPLRVELPAEQIWRSFILADFDIDPLKLAAFAEDWMLWVETHYYHREMRPEMPAVLEAIRQMDLKIGIISNTCSRLQVSEDLKSYGIQSYFDPVVLSSEYGWRKPDPSIFHYAARLANVPAGDCIYVGDSIVQDIGGAHLAGFQSAYLIREQLLKCDDEEEDLPEVPDAIFSRMDGLLAFLEPGKLQKASGPSDGKVRAILFDAGDVLYHRPARGVKLAAFLKELGHNGSILVSPAEKNALKERSLVGQVDQEQYREALIRLYGITKPEQIQRGVQILEEEDHEIHFFQGVKETLHLLKEKGFRLGIVTDSRFPVSVKLGWLEKGGFGNVWDTVISSNELGIHKPDPKIYQAALNQLGLNAGQAAFVGHAASELTGAKAAGMTTVAFNYETSAKADYFIHKFSDLLKLPIITSEKSNASE